MNGVSTVELLVRMTASLLAIGGLFWFLNRVARGRLGRIGRQTNVPLVINARKQLSKSSSIALVRAGSRNLLIGVTDAGISLLAEGDDLLIEEADSDDSAAESTSANQPFGAAIGKRIVQGVRATTALRAVGKKVDAQHADDEEVSPEMVALSRHWGEDDTSEQPRAAKSKSTKSKSTKSKSTKSSSNAEAGKPQRGATSSTESGTSALDALRAMTVRKS